MLLMKEDSMFADVRPSLRCPLCNSGNSRELFTHPVFSDSRVTRCHDCGHCFARPEPDGTVLARYYMTSYSQHRAEYYGEAYFAIMRRRARAQYRLIRRFMKKEKPDARVLDFGCGLGALTAAFTRNGFPAQGFDGDSAVVEEGRRIFGGNIDYADHIPADPPQWDVIVMSHVIEHFRDVRSSLSDVALRIRKGGLLFLEVPNCSAELVKEGFDPEPHLHYFSGDTLKRLLDGLCGRVLFLRSCGPSNSSGLSNRVMKKGTAAATTLFVKAVKIATGRNITRTTYDGYYGRYYRGDQGIWLRSIVEIT